MNVGMFASTIEDFDGEVVLQLRGDAVPISPVTSTSASRTASRSRGSGRDATRAHRSRLRRTRPGPALAGRVRARASAPVAHQHHATGRVARATPAWARNGSFLVFQRLAQDVAKFQASIAALSDAHNLPPDLLASSFVGRHASGCPLELLEGLGDLGQTRHDIGPTNPLVLQDEHINDFQFQDPDPVGFYVPHAAHIRKAYPPRPEPTW